MDLVRYNVDVHAIVVAFHVRKSPCWGLERRGGVDGKWQDELVR